jgi:hypothetical protein
MTLEISTCYRQAITIKNTCGTRKIIERSCGDADGGFRNVFYGPGNRGQCQDVPEIPDVSRSFGGCLLHANVVA